MPRPPTKGPAVGGDVQALPLGSSVVTALQGRPVSAAHPPKSSSLVWNGTAWVPGGRLASGSKTSSVTTTGTTFGTGTDLLAATLSLTADGTSSYLFRVEANSWNCSATGTVELRLNLNGTDAGRMAIYACQAANANIPLSATAIYTPSAGVYTVNIRLLTSTGTGTVNAGTAGAGNLMPIFVSVEKV